MHKHPALLPPRYHTQCVRSLCALLKMDLATNEMSNIEVWALYGLINLARSSVATFAGFSSVSFANPTTNGPDASPSTLLRSQQKSFTSLLTPQPPLLAKIDSETSLVEKDDAGLSWDVSSFSFFSY